MTALGRSAGPVADVLIVGAGVVGTAIAKTLARYDLNCVIADAGNDVGTGTTKANTAILHTGFDAVPGSLESALVRRGAELLRNYAQQAGIPLERTGALLVAWSADQHAELAGIEDKARRNGYAATRYVPADELYAREPHLGPGALGALEIPDESIICPWTTPLAYATEALQAGVRLLLRTRVAGVTAADGWHEVDTSNGTLRCRWLINAAGLESDRIDAMLGGCGFTIQPRRGELIVFDKMARSLVSSILLPVPTPQTKGVLVAPTVYGNVLLGPTAQDIPDRGDTSTTEAGLSSLVGAGRQIMPDLVREEVTATYAGLRAATEHRDYQIRVDAGRRYACAGGIRSTGLTASLGIAEYVVEQLADAGLALRERHGCRPAPPVMPYIGQAGQRPYQDSARIAADPAYGDIVCHCERVTRGEIRDALGSPLPPADLDGLRRRTRATNGRCQGFFCAARVASLMGAPGPSTADTVPAATAPAGTAPAGTAPAGTDRANGDGRALA